MGLRSDSALECSPACTRLWDWLPALEKQAEGSMGSEEMQDSRLRASIGHPIIGDSVSMT